MNRSADSTIKGFLYQFTKTLDIILKSSLDSIITCEGIEDIDVDNGDSYDTIQCKYHEEVDKFTLSKIYKPIILMMEHFALNPTSNIKYKLFAHFPNEPEGNKSISEEDCNKILQTQDKLLKNHVDSINAHSVNLKEFLNKLSFIIGPAYDSLVDDVKKLLETEGYYKDDIEFFVFPNLLCLVSELSIEKDESNRKTTKKTILTEANNNKKLLINKWIKELNSFKKIIDNKKVALKTNLNQNYRCRTFIFDSNLSSKTDELICFIDDYLRKYHYKDIHTCEPIFCVNLSNDQFKDLLTRLYKKGITAEAGMIGDAFFSERFKRRPIINKNGRKVVSREFQLKIINWENIEAVNTPKPHDYYLFMKNIPEQVDVQDVNTEVLNFSYFSHIKYIFSLSGGY